MPITGQNAQLTVPPKLVTPSNNFPESRGEEPRDEDGGPDEHDEQRDEVVEVEAVVAVGVAHDLPHDGAHPRRRVLLGQRPHMMSATIYLF